MKNKKWAILWEREPGSFMWLIKGKVKVISQSERAWKIRRGLFSSFWIPKNGFYRVDFIKDEQ